MTRADLAPCGCHCNCRIRTAAPSAVCHFCSGQTRTDTGAVIHPGPLEAGHKPPPPLRTYTLTPDEVTYCERLAAQKVAYANAKGQRSKDGNANADTLENHADGLAGEIAAARVRGFATWLPSGADKGPDSPDGAEVRTRRRPDDELWLWPYGTETHPAAPFILVTGTRTGPLTVRGWMPGPEAMHERYNNPPKWAKYPGYFVPQSHLRPIESLPRGA